MIRWACIAALLAPLLFYFYTCAPGIGMGDTALLIEYCHFRHLSTHAAVHNIAVLIGWLFYQLPGSNLAWKINLASVFTGAASVALYGWLLLRVLRSRLVALACTGVLMVSHSMWWHSTVAEAYTVNALFTVGTLWILFAPGEFERWRLIALFFIAALSIFNHYQMGILAIGATVCLVIAAGRAGPSLLVRARRALSLSLLCTLSFVVGMIPWLLVLAREVSEAGWRATRYKMQGAGFQSVMFRGDPGDGLKDVLYLLFENFPSPFLLAIVPGCVILARRYGVTRTSGLAAMFAVNTLFFGTYDSWDRFAFLLPSFVMLAFAGALAVDALWAHQGRTGRGALAAALLFSVLFPPWLYSNLADWGKQPGFWSARYGNARSANIIDFGEYRANPNKRRWRDAEEYADLLFAKLPRGAVYIDDDSRTYFPVEHFRRFYRKRMDLEISMINTWGMPRWGLDKAGFRNKVNRAWSRNGKLFIPTLGEPYRSHMPLRAGPLEKPQFERFDLDDRRHVYRLRTKREIDGP